MRFLPLCFLFICSHLVLAQPIALSGVINRYASVLEIDTCAGRIEVADTAGFQKDQSALLIQMKGADIATANNANFGQIINWHAAGRYELIVVDSVAAGAVFVRYRLVHTYDPAGKVQLVSMPRYDKAVVTDTLRPQPWNGQTGGVLTLSVSDSLILDAPVMADGAGFRGGVSYVAPVNNCTWLVGESDYAYNYGNWRGGYKGEGIGAADSSKIFGRGAQANGGGGGNDHNSGGGGGGHAGGGGHGGDNDEPSTFGCDGYFPGLGGRFLPADSSLLFLGGGGGAGHANNNLTSAGGAGGGIILLKAGTLAGSQQWISANGMPGDTANGDGGGGGGAGGTVMLYTAEASGHPVVQANAAAGGNTINNNQNRCFGPGGGGGGGYIRSNLPGVPAPAGGAPGVIAGSTNACNGSPNGAQPGAPGAAETWSGYIPQNTISFIFPEITADPQPVVACAGNMATFSISANTGPWQFQWEMNNGPGWSPVANGMGFSGFLTPELVLAAADSVFNDAMFRCVVSRPGCGAEVISAAAALEVLPAPVAQFTASIDQTTVIFDNQSVHAVAFWWDFGDGSTSSQTAPQHVYAGEGSFTVTLYAISACDTAVYTQAVSVFSSPLAAFSAPDSVLDCASAPISFSNQSSANATAFLWSFPGGNPAVSTEVNPIVTYTVSGVYTVTLIAFNSIGADTISKTIVVELLGYPNAAFDVAVVGNGLVQLTNQSQNADHYTWYFGDNTDPQATTDALHQYALSGTFTVTLVADNFCGTSILQKTIEIVLTGEYSPAESGMIRVYPNPAGSAVTVDCSQSARLPDVIRICDFSGRAIWQQSAEIIPAIHIPLDGFSPGVYCVQLYFGTGVVQRKFIKQ